MGDAFAIDLMSDYSASFRPRPNFTLGFHEYLRLVSNKQRSLKKKIGVAEWF